MSAFAPFTGFGDDSGTSVKFTVLADETTGRVPAWSGGPVLVQRKIRGSNRVNTRSLGRDPYTITLRLEFASVADLEALDALQGTTATLRYVWGVTKTVGGHHDRLGDGRDYLAIPGVRLLSLTDDAIEPDGTCEATATFQKEAV